MLYPPELRGRNRTREYFCCILDNLLSSFVNAGQTNRYESDWKIAIAAFHILASVGIELRDCAQFVGAVGPSQDECDADL